MNIKFIDQNKSLVAKVKKAIKLLNFNNVTAEFGDVFKHKGVIVSASNPSFTMGGGLDALIAKKYPAECDLIRIRKVKQNRRINDVIFTITVNDTLQATRELVDTALSFAFSHIEKNETLLLTGLGTGVGGLDEDVFVELFIKNLDLLYGHQ